MSYNLLSGCDFLTGGGYNPYGMNMTTSLYMMNFCEQLKDYYAGKSAGTADGVKGTAAGSGTTDVTPTNFQTAFQEAFRTALQKSMGITENTAVPSGTVDGTGRTDSKTVAGRTVSARSAYQAMSSYGSHPSHIWTSVFAGR